ncbi:hypothetical protein LSM04_000984 [Trypanosoma melophagium]|uniref:uncharacterized protein n=1 Tax=Trypanosoma melophagium TaxID=715481 RepID=UPI00351A9973|nr:hypothetical protein LSM04_000984 [Trypanosoma melophagium]
MDASTLAEEPSLERQRLLLQQQQYEKQNIRTALERDQEYESLLENDDMAEVLMYNINSREARVRQIDAFVAMQRKIPRRSDCSHVLLVSGNVLTMAVMASQLAMHRWKVSEAQTLTEATAILREQIARAQKGGYVVGRRIEETDTESRKQKTTTTTFPRKSISTTKTPSLFEAERQRTQEQQEQLADQRGGPAASTTHPSGLRTATIVTSTAETSGEPPSPSSSVCSADLECAMQKPPPSDMVASLVIVDTFTHEPFSDIVDHLRFFDREYGLGLIIVLLLYESYTNRTPGMLVLPQHSATLEEAYGFGCDLVLRRCFDHKVVNFCTELFMSATARWRNDVRRKAAVGNYRSVRHVLLEQNETGVSSNNDNLLLDDGYFDVDVDISAGTASPNLNGTPTLQQQQQQQSRASPAASSLSSRLQSRRGRGDLRYVFDESIGYKNEGIGVNSSSNNNNNGGGGGVLLHPSLACLSPPSLALANGVRILAGGEQQQLTSLSLAKDTLAGIMHPAQSVKHAVRRKVNLNGTFTGSDQRRGATRDENDVENELYEDVLIDEADEVQSASIAACQREIARLVSELERNERILAFLREGVAQAREETPNSQQQNQQNQHQQSFGSARASFLSLSGKLDDGFNQHISLSKEQQIFVLKQRLLEAAEKLAGYEAVQRLPSYKRKQQQQEQLQNKFNGSIGKRGLSAVFNLQNSCGSIDTDDSVRLTELFESTFTQRQQQDGGTDGNNATDGADTADSHLAGVADSVIAALRNEIAILKQHCAQQQDDSRASSRRTNWEFGRLSDRNSRLEERLTDAVNMIALQKRRIVQLEEVLQLEKEQKKQAKGGGGKGKKKKYAPSVGGSSTVATVESGEKKKNKQSKKSGVSSGDGVSTVSEETQGPTTVPSTNSSESKNRNVRSKNTTIPDVKGRANVKKVGEVQGAKNSTCTTSDINKEREKKNEENVKIQKMITTKSANALMQRLDQLFGKVRAAVERSDDATAEEARDEARRVGQVYATHIQKLMDINKTLGIEDPSLLLHSDDINGGNLNYGYNNNTSSSNSSGGDNKSIEKLQEEHKAALAVAEGFLASGENCESYARAVVHLYSMEQAMERQTQVDDTTHTSTGAVESVLFPQSNTEGATTVVTDITDSGTSDHAGLNTSPSKKSVILRRSKDQQLKEKGKENVPLIDIASCASSLHATPTVMLCRAALQELCPMKREHQQRIEEELMALSSTSINRAKKGVLDDMDSNSLDALYLTHHKTLVELLNTLCVYHPVLQPVLQYETRELEEKIAKEMSGEEKKKEGKVSARFLMAIDTSLLARLILQLSQYAEKYSPSKNRHSRRHQHSRDGQYNTDDESEEEEEYSTDDSDSDNDNSNGMKREKRGQRDTSTSVRRIDKNKKKPSPLNNILYGDDDNDYDGLTAEDVARLLGNDSVEVGDIPQRLLDLLAELEAEEQKTPSENAAATAARIRRALADINQQRQDNLDILMESLRQRKGERIKVGNRNYADSDKKRRSNNRSTSDSDNNILNDSEDASSDSNCIPGDHSSLRRVLSPSMYRCTVPPHKRHAVLRRRHLPGQTVLGADVQGDVSAEVSKRVAHLKLNEHLTKQAGDGTGADALPPVLPRGLTRAQLQQLQLQSGGNTTDHTNSDGSPLPSGLSRYEKQSQSHIREEEEEPQHDDDDDDDDTGRRVYISYGRAPLPPRMTAAAAASVERSPFTPEELAARVLAYRLAVARQRGGHRLAADPTVHPTFAIPVAAATLPPAGGPNGSYDYLNNNNNNRQVPLRGGVSAYTTWVYGVPGEQIFPMLRGAEPAHSDAVLFLPAQSQTAYAAAAGAGSTNTAQRRRRGISVTEPSAGNAFMRRMLANVDLFASPATLAAQRLNAQLQMSMTNWGMGVVGRSITPVMRRPRPSQQRSQPQQEQQDVQKEKSQ